MQRRAAEIVPYAEALREFKARYWREVMQAAGGHIATAARLSGYTRTDLYTTLRAVGIDVPRRAEKHGNAAWKELGR